MKRLDITELKQQGMDLANAIEGEVEATQRVIVQPYPSEILMRRDQYDDLAKLSGMVDMLSGTEDEAKPEDRIWVTKYNVMEVRIKKNEW